MFYLFRDVMSFHGEIINVHFTNLCNINNAIGNNFLHFNSIDLKVVQKNMKKKKKEEMKNMRMRCGSFGMLINLNRMYIYILRSQLLETSALNPKKRHLSHSFAGRKKNLQQLEEFKEFLSSL